MILLLFTLCYRNVHKDFHWRYLAMISTIRRTDLYLLLRMTK